MNNLFSTFDPQSWLSLSLNWVSCFVVIFLTPAFFWVSPNQALLSIKLILTATLKELKAVFIPLSNPGLLTVPLSLFVFIICNNRVGLVPYVFTSPSHLVFTLALAFPLWVGHIILGILKTPSSIFAHLVPLGTPIPLIPFMVLIELIRRLIRPLTLSVRLAANIIAGHLLLALIAGHLYTLPSTLLILILAGLVVLCSLECAVRLIQAYVFRVLSSLYLNEVNSLNLL